MVSQSKWILLFVSLSAFFYQIEPKELRVVCYYTNWSVYRPGSAKFNPQNINPYLCTHLIYAFGGFTKENTLKPFDKYQDIEKGGYAKFTGLKTYNKNLKTMLAIGGWNEGSSRFSPMVASADRRKELVKNVVKFLRQNHFDGLDLDWEYPSFRDGGKSRDRNNYAQLVQELREEFDKESSKTGRPRLLLTMAVPAGIEYINKGYDVPKLMKYLDWMNILSYDYHSAFEPSVNHHAPLYPLEEESEYNYDTELNIDHTIKHYLEAGAISDKLVLGIPTYGRSYTLFNPESNEIGAPADGPGDMGDATRENGYLAYYEICEGVKNNEWTVVQPNENAMGPYAYRDNQWVGYDDEEIVRKKSEYVASHDLGGIMFWAIDNDDFRGTCHNKSYPIIEAAKEALINALGLNENAIKKTGINKKPQGTRRPSGNKNSSRRRQGANRVRPSSTTTEVPRATRRRRPTTKKVVEDEPVYKESGSSLLVTPSYKTPEPPTTPDPGGDFKCEDEGFYPHPRDCKKYFWCLSGPSELGIIAHQFTCPAGLYFNKAAASCDYTQNVLCNKKIAKATTTTPTTTTKREEPTTEIKPLYSTPRPLPKITAATSRTTLHSTTTKPEYDDEYEYEDDVADDDHADSEDPIVIKELLELIKKAGGIEELEKQFNIKDSGTTTGLSGSTTPSSISKKLYERVLSRTKLIDSPNQNSKSKYKQISRNSRGPQYKETGEKSETDEKTVSRNSRLKYSTINRARPSKTIEEDEAEDEEEEEEDEISEKEISTSQKNNANKKYVTLKRNRPSTTAEPELDEEDPDDNSVNTISRSSTPKAKSEAKSRPNFLRRSRLSTTAEPEAEEEDEDDEEEDEVEAVSRRSKASVSSTTRSPYVTLKRSRPTTTAAATEETAKEEAEVDVKEPFNRRVLGETSDREEDEEDNKNYVSIKRTRPTTTTTESTQRYKEIRRSTTTPIPATEAVTEKEAVEAAKEEEETTVIPTESNSIIKDVTNTYLTTIREESVQSDSVSSPNTEKLIAESVTTSTTQLEITPPQLLEPRPFSINAKSTTDKTRTTTQTVTTTKVSYKPVLRSRPVPAQDSKYKLGINTNEQPSTSTVSSTPKRFRPESRGSSYEPPTSTASSTTRRLRPETRGFSRYRQPDPAQNYQGIPAQNAHVTHSEPERTFRPDVALDIADLSSLTAVDFSSLRDFSGAPRRPRPRFTTTSTTTTTTTTEAPEETIKTGPRTLPLARKLLEGALSSGNKRRTFTKPSLRSNVNNETSTATSTTEANVSPVKIRPLFKNRNSLNSTTEASVRPASRKVIRRFRFSTPSSTTEELTTPSTTTTTTTTTAATITTIAPTTTTTESTTTSEATTTIKSSSTTEETSEDTTTTEKEEIPKYSTPLPRSFLSPITEYVEVPETKPVEEEDENIKLSESNILENSDVSRVNSNSIKGDGEKGYKKVLKRIKPSSFRLNEDFGTTLSLNSEVSSTSTTTTKPEPSIVVRTRKIIRKLSTTPLTPSEDSLIETLSTSTQASTDLETNRKRKVIRRLKPYSLFDKNGEEEKEVVGKRYQGFDPTKNRKKLFGTTSEAPIEEEVSENARQLKSYNLFENKENINTEPLDALTPRRVRPLGFAKKEILSDTLTSSTDSSSDFEKTPRRLKPYTRFQQSTEDIEHSESITEEIATEEVVKTDLETSTNNIHRLEEYSLFGKNETTEEEVKTSTEATTPEEKESVDSVTKKYIRRLKPFGLYGKNESNKEETKANQGEFGFRPKFRSSTEANEEGKNEESRPVLRLKPSLFEKSTDGKENGLLLKRLQILNPSKYRKTLPRTTTEETVSEIKTETEESLDESTTEQVAVTEEATVLPEEPKTDVFVRFEDDEKLTVSVTEETKTSTEGNRDPTEAIENVTEEIKTSTEEARMVTEEIRTSTEESLTNLETTESVQIPSTEMYPTEELTTQLNLDTEGELTTLDSDTETTTYEGTTEYGEEQTTEPRPVYVNKIFKKAQNRPKLNLKQYSATLRTSSTTPFSTRSKSRFESYSRRPIKIKPISPSKNEDNENIGYGEVKPFKKTFTPRRPNNRKTFRRPQTNLNIGEDTDKDSVVIPKYKLSSTTEDPLADDVSEELEEVDYSSEELDSEEETEEEEDIDDDDDNTSEEEIEVTTSKLGLSTTQASVVQNTPPSAGTTKKLRRKPNNPYGSFNGTTTRSGFKRFTSTTLQPVTQNLTDINVDALNERNKKLFNKHRKMNTPYPGPVSKETTLGTESSSGDDLAESTTDVEGITSTMSAFTNEVETTNEIETTRDLEVTTGTESISNEEITTESNATPSSVTEASSTEIPLLIESTTVPQTTTEKQTTLHHIFAEVVSTTTPAVEDNNSKKLERLIEVNRIIEINGEKGNSSEVNSLYDHIGVVNRVTEIKVVDGNYSHVTIDGSNAGNSRVKIDINGPSILTEILSPGYREQRKYEIYGDSKVTNFGTPPTDLLNVRQVDVAPNHVLIDSKSIVKTITPKPLFSNEVSTISLEGLFKTSSPNNLDNQEEELLDTEHSRFVNVKYLEQDDHVSRVFADSKIAPIKILPDGGLTMKAKIVEVTRPSNSGLIKIVPIAVSFEKKSV